MNQLYKRIRSSETTWRDAVSFLLFCVLFGALGAAAGAVYTLAAVRCV